MTEATRQSRWKVSMKWEPRDLWIGIYWTIKEPRRGDPRVLWWLGPRYFHVFICLLPCLPIIIERRLKNPYWNAPPMDNDLPIPSVLKKKDLFQ